MKKPKNLQDLVQALYQSNKTGRATYWLDGPEETVQESLVDEELVIVYRGRGEESEKVYQGDLDSYEYKQAIDRDKRQKDLFRDMLDKNTITIVHRNFKKTGSS